MNKLVFQLAMRRSGPIVFYVNRHAAGRQNVLLLHGALGTAERLMPLSERLSDCNLLFCDLKGHGRSAQATTGYDPTSMALDLIGPVRETFGDSQFAVIAESFSGIVALELAKRVPSLRMIIMLDTAFDNAQILRSLRMLVDAYKKRAEQRESLRAFCREFFKLDVERRRADPVDYPRYLLGVHVPIMMITGSRKHAEDPAAEEPGAAFGPSDLQAVAAYTPSSASLRSKAQGIAS